MTNHLMGNYFNNIVLVFLITMSSYAFAAIEFEPNDLIAQPLSLDESLVGQLSSATDVDKYVLDMACRGAVTLSFSSALISSGRWEVQLVDSADNLLSATKCGGEACQTGLSIPIGVSGAFGPNYTIVINNGSGPFSRVPEGSYTVSVSYSTSTLDSDGDGVVILLMRSRLIRQSQ